MACQQGALPDACKTFVAGADFFCATFGVNVFDPNPYRQHGGWFLGVMHNMCMDVEINSDFPPRAITQAA
ncbi:MAG: hypothetical protein ACYC18_00005 [Gammaproteobacteria bacterium]|nr:hypothetical protein [Gammaproteobacteria bacterium]